MQDEIGTKSLTISEIENSENINCYYLNNILKVLDVFLRLIQDDPKETQSMESLIKLTNLSAIQSYLVRINFSFSTFFSKGYLNRVVKSRNYVVKSNC